jgi:16S rRNA (guanine527-N7)-methyltransferase
MELIKKYFQGLSDKQLQQFEQLKPLYEEWNAQINVISRKDTDNFFERHVLHSLAIAKVMTFEDGADILDIGTGGGFPGIPLAILYPNCHFTLVDSIGKKVKVAGAVAASLGLTNVTCIHDRAENIDKKFDFIVSRAVTTMPDFLKWTKNKFKSKNVHELANGILYLKGGDLREEMSTVKKFYKFYDIPNFFSEEFFETKKVVYVRN